MPTLAEIAAAIPGSRIVGNPETRVDGITHDSRLVKNNDMFAVLGGQTTNGALFVRDALDKGAVALLVDTPLGDAVSQLVVPSTRDFLGPVSSAVFGVPTRALRLIGITGTNGKTTTTYLVESALHACGQRPGVMGTVEYRFGETIWPAAHTTPEAPVVQGTAKLMSDAGATHLVLEASSHGLALGRLAGCHFRVVAFSNLTQDHLDFHQTMEEYAAAKLLLFTEVIAEEPEARIVVNLDDPFSKTILERVDHPVLTVSADPTSPAMLKPVSPPSFRIDGIRASLTSPSGPVELSSPMLGNHNLSNLLVALGIAIELGLDPNAAAKGLATAGQVPGRLERVPCDLGFAVLVDYAHTPDALERALAALEPLTDGRLICVFGCGGDRDPAKRPLMGAAVGRGSHIAVATSDNPRTEDPDDIISMILPGLEEVGTPPLKMDDLEDAKRGYVVEPDRGQAIRRAIRAARPGDTVLIAGKGHEDYQILGTTKVHFDDREQSIAAIAARAEESHG